MHKREGVVLPCVEAIKSQYLLVAQESSVSTLCGNTARRGACPTLGSFFMENSVHSLVLTLTYAGFF